MRFTIVKAEQCQFVHCRQNRDILSAKYFGESARYWAVLFKHLNTVVLQPAANMSGQYWSLFFLQFLQFLDKLSVITSGLTYANLLLTNRVLALPAWA